jgi:hypothetical protein
LASTGSGQQQLYTASFTVDDYENNHDSDNNNDNDDNYDSNNKYDDDDNDVILRMIMLIMIIPSLQ